MMAIWTFAACSDEERESKVVEGLPASLNLSITVPAADEVVTKASDEQETRVEKLALLFYKATQTNQLPVVVEITNIGQPTSTYGPTARTYTVNVQVDDPRLTSGQWYLYGVANYNNKFIDITLEELKNMTKAEMDNFCVNGSADLDIVETAVVMSGKYEAGGGKGLLELHPGKNTFEGAFTLVLRRMIAKHIFEFINGYDKNGQTAKFDPISYDLVNYSTSSTLMEREGWGANQMLGGQFSPGDLPYKANPGSLKTRIGIPIVGNKFSFYTQENARKQANNGMTPSVPLRELRPIGESHTHNHTIEGYKNDKFVYAPEGATYVVVTGKYEGPGQEGTNEKVTGIVEYTIHLGDFSDNSGSASNYAVKRNVRYNYKVTVNGVNNIIVEAQTKDESGQPGAEGEIVKKNDTVNVHLDAHYEQVLLKLNKADFINMNTFGLSIKTPKTNKVVTTRGGFDAVNDDYKWIMFGKPASPTSFKPYSQLKKGQLLCDISFLLEALTNPTASGSQQYLLVDGDYIYVTAYVDEYYDQDLPLNQFVNVADREMVFATVTEISSDGHSSYTRQPIFSIRQRSIKSPTSLSIENPIGIETIEETPTLSGMGPIKPTVERTADYGWMNTIKILDALGATKTAMQNKELKWADLINESQNGWIDGKAPQADKIMRYNYNNQYYHFLSRNRDNNGDGIIDKEEIRWFLPSHDECLAIWFGHTALPVEARFRITNADRAWINEQPIRHLTSSEDTKAVWWNDEGTAFGEVKSAETNSVRAVRMLKTYNAPMPSLYTFDKNTRVITVNSVSEGGMRVGKIRGDYAPHYTGEYADQLPQSFQIGKYTYVGAHVNEVIGTTEGLNYSDYVFPLDINPENEYYDDIDTKGQWRIPNEKEMVLILAAFEKEGMTDEICNYTIARTRYRKNYVKAGDPAYNRDLYYYTIRPNANGDPNVDPEFSKKPSDYVQKNGVHLTTHYLMMENSKCRVIFVRDVTPRSY